jgi:peroxiredoxin
MFVKQNETTMKATKFSQFLLISLFFFSCNTPSKYQHFEHTKWDGFYAKNATMSLFIDEVKDNSFYGELHWKNGNPTAYVEGSFSGDSIVFEEVDYVFGGNLVLNGTYPAVISNDTIKGAWIHATHNWSGTAYYLVQDKEFKEKTNDQKILSAAYLRTKELQKELNKLLPPEKNPATYFNDSTKQVYFDLKREKNAILRAEYAKLEDKELKESSAQELFQETFYFWRSMKDPADSILIMNEINATKEGEDGYIRKQQIKSYMEGKQRSSSEEFIKSMLEKKLSVNDQVDLLFNMAYSLNRYPDLESTFLKELEKIKATNPEHKMIEKLELTYQKNLTANRLKPGTKAPEFEVETLDGKNIKLSDFKGKYVFIDFWGSWCGPCKGEIPNIKKLVGDIPASQLQVIGLAKDKEETLKAYINEAKINYPNAIANDELLATYGISSYPTTYLINPNGIIAAKNLRGSNLTTAVQAAMKE